MAPEGPEGPWQRHQDGVHPHGGHNALLCYYATVVGRVGRHDELQELRSPGRILRVDMPKLRKSVGDGFDDDRKYSFDDRMQTAGSGPHRPPYLLRYR